MEICWTTELPESAHDVASSADGALVVAATLDGSVTALDARTGRVVWRRTLHAGGALAVDISPDGGHVASGGQDGRVVTLQLVDGAPRWERALNEQWVNHVCWSPDGARLAASAGRDVHFLTVEGAPEGAPITQASTVTSLLAHPRLGWVVACYGGAQVLVPGRSSPSRRFPFRGSVLATAASPDGRYLAAGSQDSSVRLWDLTTRQDVSLTGYPGKVTALAWDARGRWLATGGGPAVVLWRCDGPTVMGTVPTRLSAHEKRVTGVAFGSDPDTLVSAGDEGRLTSWRLDSDGGPYELASVTVPSPVSGLWRTRDGARLWCADRTGRLHGILLDTPAS